MKKIYKFIFSVLFICTPIYALTGYLRFAEDSACMDLCSVYYLEDESGEFLTWVTYLDDLDMLNNYSNRFIEMEGDSVFCVECPAVNVTSISISSECESLVDCFVDPCEVSSCSDYPLAECVSNFCDGCWADYYVNGELVFCNTPDECIDLTDIDFGDCEMVLGIGWVNDQCQYVSGCSSIVEGVDYSEAFFSTIEECQEVCTTISTPDFEIMPTSFKLYDNYPNPFNPFTIIHYNLPIDTFVDILIYDINGKPVTHLIHGQQSAGYKSILWNARSDNGLPLSSGIYLYSIKAGEYFFTKKMILLK